MVLHLVFLSLEHEKSALLRAFSGGHLFHSPSMSCDYEIDDINFARFYDFIQISNTIIGFQ